MSRLEEVMRVKERRKEHGYWNSYVAGAVLGMVLLAAFYILGSGLGASGCFTRVVVAALYAVSPDYISHHPYAAKYAGGGAPLMDWFVFLGLGVFVGGFLAGITAGRVRAVTEKGALIGSGQRMMLALAGGALAGIGSRLANGCTSGQALTGGAELALGSWAFMFAVFGGAYAAAYFVRKQWTWEKKEGAGAHACPDSANALFSTAPPACLDPENANKGAGPHACPDSTKSKNAEGGGNPQ
jgi:uncharacterized membrane protein YedE/YeeE